MTQDSVSGRHDPSRPGHVARQGRVRLAPGRAALALLLAGVMPASASDFSAFLASVATEADRQGVPHALAGQVLAELAPDPAVAAMPKRQPEFAKPLGAYLAGQVTSARVASGQALLRRWAGPLAAIETRYGVPRAILVAVWGLESNYGTAAGRQDVIRAMATLGASGVRPDLYRDEIVAALALLAGGEVSRARLVGSWAGAMGQPQFMPSSFARYAADGDQDGRRDIWTDVPDVLASIANFLKAKGWQADLPWGLQVALPQGFDLSIGRGSFADWRARGLTRVEGGPLPASGDAALFFPAGAAGPAFLATANYEVIKTYNFSDAYVLSVADLADRMAGGAPLRGPWPATVSMGREARIALQARLAALGYPVDNSEGRISLALRDTIRRAQRSVGLTPDGNPTDALLRALSAATGPAAD